MAKSWSAISSQRQNGFLGSLDYIKKELKMHKEFTILEDIVVHSVPDGIRTTLEKGKSGIISQSLGDNYTIVVEGNMYQLSGIDGEKIGEEKRELSSNNFANEEEVWNVLHTCYDPEIPVNIVDLGLVYNCELQRRRRRG